MTDQPGTIKKPDVFAYHTVPDLEQQSLEEVEALWDLVPTERQQELRLLYDRTPPRSGRGVR